jgi:hypoxanthine phosphoribosyltransferase
MKFHIPNPDYIGFRIPNRFVVGYGLDYEEKLRNLRCIGILKPEVYQGKE